MWLIWITAGALMTGVVLYGLLFVGRKGWLGYLFVCSVAAFAIEWIAGLLGVPRLLVVGIFDVGWLAIGALLALAALRIWPLV